MKLRRISLLNYIIFLLLTAYIWRYQLRKNQADDFAIDGGVQTLKDQLTSHVQAQVIFHVDQLHWNETIHQVFKNAKFSFNVLQELPQLTASSYEHNINRRMVFSISQGENERLVSHNLTYHECLFKTIDEESKKAFLREVKRIVISLLPNPLNEEPSEQSYLYHDKLLIFDLYVLSIEQGLNIQSSLGLYREAILAYMATFGISVSHVRINYKVKMIEILQDYLILDGAMARLRPNGIKDLLAEHGLENQHRSNFQEYILSNTILILGNEQQSLIQEDSQEEYQFMYRSPNTVINYINIPEASTIYAHVHELFIRKLELQEQCDLFETLQFFAFEEPIALVAAYFQKREQLRQYLRWAKELQLVQFIEEEPDYLITFENQLYVQQKVAFMQSQVAEFTFNLLDSQQNSIDITRSNEYAQFDTFSFEYLMGIYLPIILPFAYPIIMGLVDEIKQSKHRALAKIKID